MSKRLSSAEIVAIRERVEKATPGPWIIEESRHETSYNVGNSKYDFSACLTPLNDAEFISAAREDVPALLALVVQQQKEIERLREIISWQMSCVGCGNQLAEDWENVEGTPICRNCFDYGGDDE